jgi:hypothetical protein
MTIRTCWPSALVLAVALPVATASAWFLPEDAFGDGHTVPVAWADHDLDGDLDLTVGLHLHGA